MAKCEFLHKRTNRRTVKPITAVKIAKVPDEASEIASDQSLDIVFLSHSTCLWWDDF